MATKNITVAFRPSDALLGWMDENAFRKDMSLYGLLVYCVETTLGPDDGKRSPEALEKTTARRKLAEARAAKDEAKKPPKVPKTPDAPASPKQKSFREALKQVHEGPVKPAPGSRLKKLKGEK